MVGPIDMGVILKSIDEVARINKNKETNLTNQQMNAAQKLDHQQRLEKSKVVKSTESIFNSIDPNKDNRRSDINNLKKRDLRKKQMRGKDPNKGRWLDIDA